MSLLGFQQALSELVMSPEFCSTVKTDPEQTLSAFDLTPLEYQRLAILATQPGLSIGTMIHRSFRLSMIVHTLPKTCMLLEFHGLKEIMHWYWRTQLPRNFYFEQEAARFGEFMFAQLKQGLIQSEFLEEILRFELAVLSLEKLGSREFLAGSRGKKDSFSLLEGARCTDSERAGYSNPNTDFPYLNPLYRIVFFRHEPEILLQALDEGRMPEHVTQGNYYLLLARPENQLQIKRVGSRLGELLSACDGQNSVAVVCTQLSLAVRDLEVLAEKDYIFFKGSCDRAIAGSA